MLIAIDPDVFQAYLTEGKTYKFFFWALIRKLLDEGKYIQFVLDETLANEYLNLRAKLQVQDEDGSARRIVEILTADPPGENVKKVSSSLSADIERIFNQYYLRNPNDASCRIDKSLFGMVHNSQDEVYIVLPGYGIQVGTNRYRNLYKSTLREELCDGPYKGKKLNLNICEANHTEIRLPFEPADTMRLVHQLHSRLFEKMVSPKIKRLYPRVHFLDELPDYLESMAKKDGDIDVYGENKTRGITQIWFGECKLREEGMENRYLEFMRIESFLKRFDKVKEVIQEQRPDETFTWVPFIVTNANGFHPDAKQALRNIEAKYFHTILSEGWRQDFRFQVNSLIEMEL